MEQVQALVIQYFSTSNQELNIGGLPISQIADQYGTPFFVYDQGIILQKWLALRNALPPEFEISYSVKANPNPTILKLFLAQGLGLEIASAGELNLALQAGCTPDKILFAGPGKTEAELELALKHGIGEIHIESFKECDRISSLSRKLGIIAKIAIRINPSQEAQGGAMQMGGKSAPFGIDEEMLDSILDQILDDPYLELRGIHLFTGTQILDYQVLITQYRKGLEIAQKVATRLQKPLHRIDFGGGYGIPYFTNEVPLDLTKLNIELTQLIAETKQNPLFNGTEFLIEPGRYLVGEAGIYVARINDIKISRGKKFLILDGGMNHHLAASGNLGQVIKRNYPVAILNKLTETAIETVDVVGPLCTPLDTLARAIQLPTAAIGDLIGVFQSGAYGRTASPLGFLSHPTPPEVWVENGEHSLIRQRYNYESLDKQT